MFSKNNDCGLRRQAKSANSFRLLEPAVAFPLAAIDSTDAIAGVS